MSVGQTSASAKQLYRGAGLVSGMIGGLIASQGYKHLFKRLAHNDLDQAPQPLSTEYPFKKIVISTAIQGAIYALVKMAIDRAGARMFERVTGEWPGK